MMLFRRFLKRFKRAKRRSRIGRVKAVFFDEAGGKREVFGTLLRGEIPYFVSHDKKTKGHILSVLGQLLFFPDKKDD